jgi:hypothetical protein
MESQSVEIAPQRRYPMKRSLSIAVQQKSQEMSVMLDRHSKFSESRCCVRKVNVEIIVNIAVYVSQCVEMLEVLWRSPGNKFVD